MNPYTPYSGRAFGTRVIRPTRAIWAPLERVARLSRSTDELLSFHEGEFMYMLGVRNSRKNLDIHLYKHIDTRCYINLGSDGHAYAYCPPVDDTVDDRGGGRYRQHRDLTDAIDGLELWLFDDGTNLYRSFPPEDWPPDLRLCRFNEN